MNKVTLEDIDRLVERAQSPLDVDWLENLGGEKHNYHRFLYLLMEFMQPKVALEIGTFYGMGAMHMGEAAKLYGGKALSIDNGTLVDYNAYKFPNENFEFIRGDSCAQTTYGQVVDAGQLELVYHDSYPAYVIADIEFRLYSQRMEPGTVWIADHLFKQRAWDNDTKDMRTFFDEIPSDQKIVYTDVLQQGIDQGIAIL
jgi:predicted O-methyltransferase YrrM